MKIRTLAMLAIALHGTVQAGEVLLDIPTRPGAAVRVLEMTGERAASHVVLYLAGGSGQRGLQGVWPGSLPSDPDTLFGAQRQMAEQVGAMVALDTASDHEVLDIGSRQGPAHGRTSPLSSISCASATRKRTLS